MFIKDIFKIASINAFRGKTRSLLTALSILIGVSSVLLVSSIGTAGEFLITRELEKLGLQGISIYQNRDEDSAPLSADDAQMLKRRFKNITRTLPVVMEIGTYRLNQISSDAILFGVGEQANQVYNVTLLHGRAPNDADIKSRGRVVVIDDELAYKTHRRSNVVGKELVVKFNEITEKFKIIGVIKSQKDGVNQMFGNNIPDFLYLPYTTLNEYRKSDDISQIAIKCEGEYEADGKEFAEYLSKVKSSPNGYIAENVSSKMSEIKSITGLISLLISAIASIALCVAGLGIMNTMFSSTAERKREIGICMAVGASAKVIMLCFLFESIIVALLGGTLGGVIGCASAVIVSNALNLEVVFNIKILLIAEIISVLCGGIFSVLPALKAAKMNPIDALRRN